MLLYRSREWPYCALQKAQRQGRNRATRARSFLRRVVKGRWDFVEGFTIAAVGGYVGTVLAMGLGDWIVPFVYTQTIAGFDYAVYTWVLLGAALSLYHIVSKPEGMEA